MTALFVLLEFASPSHNVHILWFTYPANTNVLVSLISFGTSGIYLSFFLTVVGAAIARARGWVPEGKFQLGRWAWPVIIVAGLYLLVMLVNMVAPTGLTSPRGYFNLDWITLVVMIIVFIVGAILFAALPWRQGNRRAPAGRRGEARRGQVTAVNSEQSGSSRTISADSPSRHRLWHGGESLFPLVPARAPVAVIRRRARSRVHSRARTGSGS